jgi:predicted enzyme related to lactoylglutathione lyase
MALRDRTQRWGVAIDAPDARELADFYVRLLGWRVCDDSPEWVTIAPAEDAANTLAFATEPKYARPVWPAVEGRQQMSMHLDIAVDDLGHAVAYAVEVGATVASFQPQETVRVMLDPAGHPFCLYLETSD